MGLRSSPLSDIDGMSGPLGDAGWMCSLLGGAGWSRLVDGMDGGGP